MALHHPERSECEARSAQNHVMSRVFATFDPKNDAIQKNNRKNSNYLYFPYIINNFYDMLCER
jgi:hypothetical protein